MVCEMEKKAAKDDPGRSLRILHSIRLIELQRKHKRNLDLISRALDTCLTPCRSLECIDRLKIISFILSLQDILSFFLQF